MRLKRLFIGTLLLIFLASLYSYKLLEVPTGLTSDEAAFGYNAVLIANTARDENGRLLPIFIRHSGTTDYHQPVTQYFIVFLFKIFGPSVFLLRFSSVLVALASVVLLYLLAEKVLDDGGRLVAILALIIAPQMMLQAHMGQENIMPVPFTILWLLSFWHYRHQRRIRWLIVAALALGLSFYTYKGMHAITPIWLILSLGWLILDYLKQRTKARDLFIFSASIAPFFLAIPLLERLYPGAIFGGATVSFNNIYEFLQPYLSSFDLSYLFIRGDIVEIHSTGRHGMVLLATLPLVLTGIYQSLKSKDQFFKFILLALTLGPILYGLVGSSHRFSRLMALIPLFALFAGLGWQRLINISGRWVKFTALAILISLTLNYLDFIKFYWQTYPPLTFSLLGDMQNYRDMERFAKLAKEKNLQPLIHQQIAQGGGVSIKFFQEVYFSRLLPVIPDGEAGSPGTILLTQRQVVPKMKEIPGKVIDYHVQVIE